MNFKCTSCGSSLNTEFLSTVFSETSHCLFCSVEAFKAGYFYDGRLIKTLSQSEFDSYTDTVIKHNSEVEKLLDLMERDYEHFSEDVKRKVKTLRTLKKVSDEYVRIAMDEYLLRLVS